MRLLYNILSYIAYGHIWVAQLFSKKLKLFVKGRKQSFALLNKAILEEDRSIWMHCASLGEFEQGVPILKELKNQFPTYKIVVTFFSPSGYEIKKNTPLADVVTYLPFDTKINAIQFIQAAKPALALFVKYEIWPNYLLQLQKLDITTFLVSGLFREKQVFFMPYGGFMRKVLKCFDHFFLQDLSSEKLLRSLHFNNITVTGDTRFDRVSHQIEQDNSLAFMEIFKEDALCVVCGSTWTEDEAVLIPYINKAPAHVKFVIAPHKIEATKINVLLQQLEKDVIIYSQISSEDLLKNKEENTSLAKAKVLIVDTIGLLTKVYSYADLAYVGGAMGNTGLHNILEAATFGIPIVIGKNFDNFPEAIRLQQLAGLFSISTSEEAIEIFEKLIEDKNFRVQTGMIAGHFVNSNTGATHIVMKHIHKTLTP